MIMFPLLTLKSFLVSMLFPVVHEWRTINVAPLHPVSKSKVRMNQWFADNRSCVLQNMSTSTTNRALLLGLNCVWESLSSLFPFYYPTFIMYSFQLEPPVTFFVNSTLYFSVHFLPYPLKNTYLLRLMMNC